jgi:hypothetical protein
VLLEENTQIKQISEDLSADKDHQRWLDEWAAAQ